MGTVQAWLRMPTPYAVENKPAGVTGFSKPTQLPGGRALRPLYACIAQSISRLYAHHAHNRSSRIFINPEDAMLDLIFLAGALGFFALGAIAVRASERL